MKTLAVIALKGGSGKTTVAAHLAIAAHRRGLDTLVVDADRQRSVHNILSMRAGPGPAVVHSKGPKLSAAKLAALGLGKQLTIIDTQAGAIEDVTNAILLADLAVLVVRPTLLDLSGLAPALALVRRLGTPSIVVVNQAPVAREKVESPLVKRALRALEYMRADVAKVIVRTRTIYQTALETGRSAEETSEAVAAKEIAALWKIIEAELEAVPVGPAEAKASASPAFPALPRWRRRRA